MQRNACSWQIFGRLEPLHSPERNDPNYWWCVSPGLHCALSSPMWSIMCPNPLPLLRAFGWRAWSPSPDFRAKRTTCRSFYRSWRAVRGNENKQIGKYVNCWKVHHWPYTNTYIYTCVCVWVCLHLCVYSCCLSVGVRFVKLTSFVSNFRANLKLMKLFCWTQQPWLKLVTIP